MCIYMYIYKLYITCVYIYTLHTHACMSANTKNTNNLASVLVQCNFMIKFSIDLDKQEYKEFALEPAAQIKISSVQLLCCI